MRPEWFTIVVLLAFVACTSSPEGPSPIQYPPIATLRQIVVEQTGYDTLLVRNSSNLLLSSQVISKVIIGTMVGGEIRGRDSVVPHYTQTPSRFSPQFQFIWKCDSLKPQESIVVRYVFLDNTTATVETTVSTIRYPFAGATLHLFYRDILTLSWLQRNGIQDFDLEQSMVYFNPYGTIGLFRYDIVARATTFMYMFPAGDHLAHDSTFVFLNQYYRDVLRFNLVTNSVDRHRIGSGTGSSFICGMETVDRVLYVRYFSFLTNNSWLLKYDYNLSPLDSMQVPRFTWGMTIGDGILYTLDWSNVVRVDLSTGSFLPDKLLPTRGAVAVRLKHGRLYFSDDIKRVVYWVPVSDVQ